MPRSARYLESRAPASARPPVDMLVFMACVRAKQALQPQYRRLRVGPAIGQNAPQILPENLNGLCIHR
jgi:hypothetical protein